MNDTADSQFEIRSFEPSDRPSVVALWQTVFPDDPPRNDPATVVERKLRVQPDLFLVATWHSRLIGTVLAGFDGYRGWVYHLAVSPNERGRGFGRALMSEAEERLRGLGCPKLNLQVRPDNPEAVAFYQRLGYAVEERVSMGKCLP